MKGNVFEQLLSSVPIDQQTAIVVSGGSDDELPVFIDLSPGVVRRQSRIMQRQTNISLSGCKDIICRNAGYDSFLHYVEVLKSRDEYINAADANQRKRVKRGAKRFASEIFESVHASARNK